MRSIHSDSQKGELLFWNNDNYKTILRSVFFAKYSILSIRFAEPGYLSDLFTVSESGLFRNN